MRWEMTHSIRRTLASARKDFSDFTAESTVDFLFSENAHEIAPWQYQEELRLLAKEIEECKPRTVVEIGTASGGTLFLASALAADDALIISIDLPEGEFGGGYPSWKVPLYSSFKRKKQRIELIRGNSHEPGIFQQVESLVGSRRIDYLFLDGDHTYEGVKKDFSHYAKLLGENALVAFHDIVSDKSIPPTHFVSVFWNEIKKQYPSKEFIRGINQSKLGIGVIRVNHQT